jgi:hypothetical protein
MLRLLPASARAKRYRKVKLALRRANGILRDVRDSAVARETLGSIARRLPTMRPAILALEQLWLLRGDPRSMLSARDCRRAHNDLKEAARLIRKGFARQWRDHKLLLEVTNTYRKASRFYRRAARTHSKHAWHECRKQTKCLYYQLNFMGLPKSRGAILQQVRLLESTLGRQRDIALLAKQIRRLNIDSVAGASDVLLYLHKRHRALQRLVNRYAAALFRSDPSAFARRVHQS